MEYIYAETKLDGVICDYVFLNGCWDKDEWTERRPIDPKQNLVPGELMTLFQIS